MWCFLTEDEPLLHNMYMRVSQQSLLSLGMLQSAASPLWVEVATATLYASTALLLIGVGLALYLILGKVWRQLSRGQVQGNAGMREGFARAYANHSQLSPRQMVALLFAGGIGCVALAGGEMNGDWRVSLVGLVLIVSTLIFALWQARWRR